MRAARLQKTGNGWKSGKNKEEGKTEEILDGRGAGIDEDVPGGVQQSGRKQTFVAKNKHGCYSRGGH